MDRDDLNALARHVAWPGETKVDLLGLSARTIGVLRRAGLGTLADLRARPDHRIRIAPRLGPDAAEELRAALERATWLGPPVADAPPTDDFRGVGERPPSSEKEELDWAIDLVEKHAKFLTEDSRLRLESILRRAI